MLHGELLCSCERLQYFVSNMTAGPGVSLEWMLWVAFSRWPVERCFELAKRNLGMDHFEIRSWRGIHRHLYISQSSRFITPPAPGSPHNL